MKRDGSAQRLGLVKGMEIEWRTLMSRNGKMVGLTGKSIRKEGHAAL